MFATTNLMRVRALRRLPLAYGLTMNAPPPRAVSDSYVRSGYESAAIRRDTKMMLRALSNKHTLAAAESFDRFTQPVLVAWAAEDRLFPRSLARRLAAAFPNGRLELIEGARTFIGEDQPARLAHLIGEFIASSSPATTASAVAAS